MRAFIGARCCRGRRGRRSVRPSRAPVARRAPPVLRADRGPELARAERQGGDRRRGEPAEGRVAARDDRQVPRHLRARASRDVERGDRHLVGVVARSPTAASGRREQPPGRHGGLLGGAAGGLVDQHAAGRVEHPGERPPAGSRVRCSSVGPVTTATSPMAEFQQVATRRATNASASSSQTDASPCSRPALTSTTAGARIRRNASTRGSRRQHVGARPSRRTGARPTTCGTSRPRPRGSPRAGAAGRSSRSATTSCTAETKSRNDGRMSRRPRPAG